MVPLVVPHPRSDVGLRLSVFGKGYYNVFIIPTAHRSLGPRYTFIRYEYACVVPGHSSC
jgi:hypothetical protein